MVDDDSKKLIVILLAEQLEAIRDVEERWKEVSSGGLGDTHRYIQGLLKTCRVCTALRLRKAKSRV